MLDAVKDTLQRSFFWWVDISIRKGTSRNSTWKRTFSVPQKMLCRFYQDAVDWVLLVLPFGRHLLALYISVRMLTLLDNGEKRAINSDTLTKKAKTRDLCPSLWWRNWNWPIFFHEYITAWKKTFRVRGAYCSFLLDAVNFKSVFNLKIIKQ